MRLLLLGNVLRDGSTSMHVYLRDLLKHLGLKGANYLEPSSLIRPSMYKIFMYPLKTLFYRGYDIYHVLDHSYSWLCWFLPRRKTVVTCHDIIPLVLKNSVSRLQRLIFRFYLSGINKSKVILSISESTKEDLVKELGIERGKIKVVPYGIDLSIFRKLDEKSAKERHGLKGKKVLLGTGHNYYKNTFRILESLKRLSKEDRDIVFVKVGCFLDSEEEFIKDNNLEDFILRKRNLSQEELNDHYNAADMLVFPSLYEGFGRPPLEAMACGTPVIASNAASLPEVVGDAAIKVDPHSQEEIDEAINRLLKDKKLRKELEEKGYKNIKRFSWDKHIKELKKVYKEIANEKN